METAINLLCQSCVVNGKSEGRVQQKVWAVVQTSFAPVSGSYKWHRDETNQPQVHPPSANP